MNIETQTVQLRRLTASEGMVITDLATQTMRAKEIYLGKSEDEHSFIEIDENTPLPEPEQAIE